MATGCSPKLSDRVHFGRAVSLPPGSAIAELYPGADLADAYALRLPPDTSRDVETLGRFVLGDPPPWLRPLMDLRDTMVAGFGLKTSRQLLDTPAASGRVYIFRVYAVGKDEMILGEDDKHLDFRLSILVRADGAEREIVVTTVVHCHNLLGRIYLRLITPFHRLVVRSYLRRAARGRWPKGHAA